MHCPKAILVTLFDLPFSLAIRRAKSHACWAILPRITVVFLLFSGLLVTLALHSECSWCERDWLSGWRRAQPVDCGGEWNCGGRSRAWEEERAETQGHKPGLDPRSSHYLFFCFLSMKIFICNEGQIWITSCRVFSRYYLPNNSLISVSDPSRVLEDQGA